MDNPISRFSLLWKKVYINNIFLLLTIVLGVFLYWLMMLSPFTGFSNLFVCGHDATAAIVLGMPISIIFSFCISYFVYTILKKVYVYEFTLSTVISLKRLFFVLLYAVSVIILWYFLITFIFIIANFINYRLINSTVFFGLLMIFLLIGIALLFILLVKKTFPIVQAKSMFFVALKDALKWNSIAKGFFFVVLIVTLIVLSYYYESFNIAVLLGFIFLIAVWIEEYIMCVKVYKQAITSRFLFPFLLWAGICVVFFILFSAIIWKLVEMRLGVPAILVSIVLFCIFRLLQPIVELKIILKE